MRMSFRCTDQGHSQDFEKGGGGEGGRQIVMTI